MTKFRALYALFQIFSSLFLWLPVFYEYQKHLGLTDSQIFTIQSVYYTVFCLLEIPSGLIADYFGRLRSLRAGATALLISHCLVIFSPTFMGFLAHFVLLALGRSLITGASSAYLYDRLSSLGEAADYKKVEGGARAIGLVGRVICWPAMGFLVQWYRPFPYWLTGCSVCIAFFIVMAFPKEDRTTPKTVKIATALGFFGTLKPALLLLKSSPRVIGIILQGIALFVMARVIQVNLFQPLLLEKSFPLAASGVIMSAMTVFEALGAANSILLRRWLSDFSSIFFLSLLSVGCLYLMSSCGDMGTVVVLCLFALMVGMGFPIQKQLLNDSVPDPSYRATLLSIEAFIDRACCASVVFMIGPFLESAPATEFLNLAAGVILLGLLLLGFAMKEIQLCVPRFVKVILAGKF